MSTVLSTAQTPPFPINEAAEADEPLRLKYRYLDLRREQINQRMVKRSQLLRALSDVHHRHGFVEVETPLLIKSTPGGARDFIVPSRVQPGNIYALPQSPQQLKQLLMVAGFDRYFQIAHCMRDEDSRADRGPEFTQLDLEMSFVSQEDVMSFVETMVTEVDARRRARSTAPPDAVSALLVSRGDRPLRVGQARRPVRHGAARPERRRRGQWLRRVRQRRFSRAGGCSGWPRLAWRARRGRRSTTLTSLAKKAGAKGPRPHVGGPGGIGHLADPEVPGRRPSRSDRRGGRRVTGRPRADRRRRRTSSPRRCWASCASSLPRDWGWSGIRTSCRTCGSTPSRCTSGIPRTSAGTRRTTRSAVSIPRTRSC